MENKYFDWISNGYYKPGGVLYAPKGTDTLLIKDAKEISGWRNLVFTLKNGMYMPYHAANVGANLVNEELKNVIESFLPIPYPLEFLPVKAISDEYGERQYYIMHFKIVFDVLDRENSIYNTFIPRDDTAIIKPCLDLKKVGELHIFNSRPHINDIIVSDKLRKAIKKQKFDIGIEFSRLNCM